MDNTGILHPGQWDIFCRVIDNHGDIGVCWRLAADLAAHGAQVQLWVDDASALAWMAPAGAPGVSVRPWNDVDAGFAPGDVVVEAFGCELPVAVVGRMTSKARAPVWINLEYLSAEGFVERSHGLRSPQAGVGAGLDKWFYYPGFTARTGGLIREPDLWWRQQAFDRTTWLQSKDISWNADERVVSLFCYEQPALPTLLDALATNPTLLLVSAGHAARQVKQCLGPALRRGALRAVLLPALAQTDFDHVLWASDLNFVRGEDSFVRAQWAGVPFVWQIYPQAGGADAVKLQAFLDRHLNSIEPEMASGVRRVWAAWNNRGSAASWPTWPNAAAWQRHCAAWRDALRSQPDLTSQLVGFAAERR